MKKAIAIIIWDFIAKERKYWVDPAYIWISGYDINRETLVYEYGSSDYQCSVVKEDFDFSVYFVAILGGLIEEQEAKNKL